MKFEAIRAITWSVKALAPSVAAFSGALGLREV